MKINSVPSFKAEFNKNNYSNAIFLRNAYFDAKESGRVSDFKYAKEIIKNSYLADGDINVIKTSPQKDVFKIESSILSTPIEVTFLKKQNSKTEFLDSFLGFAKLMKQTFGVED